MAAPAEFIAHGDPSGTSRRSWSLSRRALDRLVETAYTNRQGAWLPGYPHPDFPGMIIEEVEEEEDSPENSYSVRLTCEGARDNLFPEKVIFANERLNTDAAFDDAQRSLIIYEPHEKAITGTASTDVVSCPSHKLPNGTKVALPSLTGGAGLSVLTPYFVRDATKDTFKLAATLGGSAVDFTTDISAGTVQRYHATRGHQHPLFPYMFAAEVVPSGHEADPWKTVNVTYRGKIGTKPEKRRILVNGQSTSSSQKIVVTGVTNGWGTEHFSQVQMPKIALEIFTVQNTAPRTDEVPTVETPTDPPDIQSLSIWSMEDDNLVYNWPNGWSLLAEEELDNIPGTDWRLVRSLYEYIWPILHR